MRATAQPGLDGGEGLRPYILAASAALCRAAARLVSGWAGLQLSAHPPRPQQDDLKLAIAATQEP